MSCGGICLYRYIILLSEKVLYYFVFSDFSLILVILFDLPNSVHTTFSTGYCGSYPKMVIIPSFMEISGCISSVCPARSQFWRQEDIAFGSWEE